MSETLGLDGDLYADRDGRRYTTATFAGRDDPWWGATILTERIVDDLGAAGLLPLTEVVRPKWADQPRTSKRRVRKRR